MGAQGTGPPDSRNPGPERRERKRFLLRLTPELHAVLERWAADELRSLNGHIEYLLQDAVNRAGRWHPKRPPAPPSG